MSLQPHGEHSQDPSRPPSPDGDAVFGDKVLGDKVLGDKIQAETYVGTQVLDQRRLLSGRAALALGALGLVLLAAAAVTIYQVAAPALAPAEEMHGLFNVAVARFGSPQAPGASEVADLTQSIYRNIDDQLRQLEQQGTIQTGTFTVWPPDKTEALDGSTPGERAQRAEALAGRMKADVVIYLALSDSGVSSEFYISPDVVYDAEELSGPFQFGAALPLSSAGSGRAQKLERSAQLQGRLTALAQFVIGLSYYSLAADTPQDAAKLSYYDRAASLFDQARGTWEAQGHGAGLDSGKEVLYLFVGNAAAQRAYLDRTRRAQRYHEALTAYAQALALDDAYARAHLGVAAVRFEQSRGDCVHLESLDQAGLDQALAEYDAALKAAVRPPLANIEAKVAFGRGTVLLCRSLAGMAGYTDEARRDFEAVITGYTAGDEAQRRRLRDLAAQSYANLGLLELLAASHDGYKDQAILRKAIADYEQAIPLSATQSLQGVYYARIGFLQSKLGSCEAADTAYASAIQLNQTNAITYTEERAALKQTCP